jgi:tetratricopeptide (TPR) repeat protein
VEPHNYFLQLACEHGIFGLLAFLWLVISFFWSTVNNFLNEKRSDNIFLATTLAIGILGFLVVAATTMQEITNLVFFWVFLGLSTWSGKTFKKSSFQWDLSAAGKTIWSFAIVLTATALFFFSSRYALADVYYESGARIMRSKAYQYLDYATIDLKTSIAYFPYNSEIYRELGHIYLDAFKRTGQSDYLRPAIDSFEQAVRVNPYDYEAFSALGETYLFASRALGQSELIEKSRQVFIRLLTTRFDQPFSHYMLGRIYIERDQTSLAVDEWKTSARLSPKYSAPYFGLATIYLKEGDIDNAVKMYREALKVDPDNPAVKELGKQLNL